MNQIGCSVLVSPSSLIGYDGHQFYVVEEWMIEELL